MLTVCHGATCIVERPLCHAGRPNLDFGQGFYITDLKDQTIASKCLRFVKAEPLNDIARQKGGTPC